MCSFLVKWASEPGLSLQPASPPKKKERREVGEKKEEKRKRERGKEKENRRGRESRREKMNVLSSFQAPVPVSIEYLTDIYIYLVGKWSYIFPVYNETGKKKAHTNCIRVYVCAGMCFLIHFCVCRSQGRTSSVYHSPTTPLREDQ